MHAMLIYVFRSCQWYIHTDDIYTLIKMTWVDLIQFRPECLLMCRLHVLTYCMTAWTCTNRTTVFELRTAHKLLFACTYP